MPSDSKSDRQNPSVGTSPSPSPSVSPSVSVSPSGDATPTPAPAPTPNKSEPPTPTSALSFDAVVTQYAAARPGYPPELFSTIEELAGRSLAGATVVDVGAGTGIATRLLRDRGAHVIAVEPGPAMGAELRATQPDTPLLCAVGDALPLATASVDFVMYAQAFHWTDPTRSVPEALRVLRPGGALAVWWNTPDPEVEWAAEQEARLKSRLPGYHANPISGDAPEVIRTAVPTLTPTHRRLHWTRQVPLSTHLSHLASRSYFATLGPDRSTPVLAAEQAHLRKTFPNDVVEEAYALDITLVRTPPVLH